MSTFVRNGVMAEVSSHSVPNPNCCRTPGQLCYNCRTLQSLMNRNPQTSNLSSGLEMVPPTINFSESYDAPCGCHEHNHSQSETPVANGSTDEFESMIPPTINWAEASKSF